MGRMKVQYVGVTSDFRGLTEKDLSGWGIKVDLPPAPPLARRYVADNTWTDAEQRPLDPSRDLVWGPHNSHTLELDVSPDLETLLRAQGHFLLTEIKDSGADGEEIAPPTDITHPGDVQTARDGDTPVQVSMSDRAVDPAVTERPDPTWEAMQAREEAAAREEQERQADQGDEA